jgi:DNA topoisomerase-2
MKPVVEDIYKKVTQVEHVLLRPDMYVGSIEPTSCEQWVWDEDRFMLREIEFHPALYKIFDEILVNAADNYQRDKSMRTLTVELTNTKITVENDGKGIPV